MFKIIEARCVENNQILPSHVRRRYPPGRERLGLSQEEFAERANVHRTYISSIELGKVSMGIEIAHALADALGMRLSELVHKAE